MAFDPISSTPVRHWAGFSLERPLTMGILNVTPDSFSDGGRSMDADTATATGLRLAAEGADIIDIGGESTRPGSAAVSPEEEQRRILPVIAALARQGIVLSVDTRNAATMRLALDAGARIVNDVSGLMYDPDAMALVAARNCPVVLMHMRGTPATMNSLARYADVVGEVRTELRAVLDRALSAGVRREQIMLDPGVGFAKLDEHSIAVLRGLPSLATLGYPLLVGVSRKRFIGRLSGEPRADQRLGGSVAAALFAVDHGAAVVRVHDVAATVQAIRVWQSLAESGRLMPHHAGDAG